MSITIRKAGIDDTGIVAQLFNAYRVWYHQQPDLEGALHFIRERLQNNESIIFLAEEDSVGIGFTQLYPIFTSVGMGKAFLLNDLFVKDTARGKGVATALLNAAGNHAKMANGKWIMLQTNNDNYAAQSLYEKNGWVKESDFFYSVKVM